MSTPAKFPIVNPNIYLNYLTPSVATQFEIARDLSLATLGALLWDLLVSLPQDLILAKAGYSLERSVYFLSRLSALTYVLLSVILMTHPIVHCSAMQLGAMICWVAATASSSFLLLRRIQTVFREESWVQHFFVSLFILNVGLSTVVPIGIRVSELAATGYCISTSVKAYASAAIFSRLVYDLFVFLAVSYRLGIKPSSEAGKGSPHSLRPLLQDGQLYYLIAVCFNLIVAALILVPSVSPTFQTMFIIPDISLSTSMAARVYRNVELTRSVVKDPSSSNSKSGMVFNKTAPVTNVSALTGSKSVISTTQQSSSDGSTYNLSHPSGFSVYSLGAKR